MNKILISGDTHGYFLEKITLIEEKGFLDKYDKIYLIICGDFGLFFNYIGTEDDYYQINKLNRYNGKIEILFIDGNHDNFYKLNSIKRIERFNGKMGVLAPNIYHLRRGECYNIEGTIIFTLGGGISIDKHLRKIGVDWWEEEIPSIKDCQNGINSLKKYNFKVDYIITHSAPESLFDLGEKNPIWKEEIRYNLEDPTKKMLDHFYKNTQFKRWYLGHYHLDIDIDNFTILYNKIIELGDIVTTGGIL